MYVKQFNWQKITIHVLGFFSFGLVLGAYLNSAPIILIGLMGSFILIVVYFKIYPHWVYTEEKITVDEFSIHNAHQDTQIYWKDLIDFQIFDTAGGYSIIKLKSRYDTMSIVTRFTNVEYKNEFISFRDNITNQIELENPEIFKSKRKNNRAKGAILLLIVFLVPFLSIVLLGLNKTADFIGPLLIFCAVLLAQAFSLLK